MVEGYNAVGSLRRSSELVKGSWWRVFGIGLVLWILVTLISQMPPSILTAILGAIMGRDPVIVQILESGLVIVLFIITIPIALIDTTLLYFDLRIRKKAFDIEMMAKNVHGVIICPTGQRESDSQARFFKPVVLGSRQILQQRQTFNNL
jgi:hypothetical protein